jgi:hypothetical protein
MVESLKKALLRRHTNLFSFDYRFYRYRLNSVFMKNTDNTGSKNFVINQVFASNSCRSNKFIVSQSPHVQFVNLENTVDLDKNLRIHS